MKHQHNNITAADLQQCRKQRNFFSTRQIGRQITHREHHVVVQAGDFIKIEMQFPDFSITKLTTIVVILEQSEDVAIRHKGGHHRHEERSENLGH